MQMYGRWRPHRKRAPSVATESVPLTGSNSASNAEQNPELVIHSRLMSKIQTYLRFALILTHMFSWLYIQLTSANTVHLTPVAPRTAATAPSLTVQL